MSNSFPFRRCMLLVGAATAGLMVPAAASAAASATIVAPGERGQINGVVKTASGGYAVGAEVRIDGFDLVAVTDSEGRFAFRSVPLGSYDLTVSYFGAAPSKVAATVEGGKPADVVVTLDGAAAGDDSIVVTGARPIAESEAAALQMQRASTSLINVVAADSIGRFPDQNIAAALSRVPGIAVQRDQGQERYVNLRGAPSKWTTISFDGVNVISPAGRETRFDTIPSAIASKVVVRKAVTPDMPGETVAGNIDLLTRGAFDYPGLKMAADAAIGYNDLGGGKQYNVGGFISDRFANDTIGVLLSASRYERDMVTDNFENGFEIAKEDQQPGRDERVWVKDHQNKLYRLTRTNTAFTGRLDWRPSDEHRFFLNSVYTEFTDKEMRTAFEIDFDDFAAGYADITAGNTPMQGTVYGAQIDSTLNANNSRQSVFTSTLGGDHELGAWDVDWRLNFTRADSKGRQSYQSTWQSPKNPALRPTVDYDFTDRKLGKIRLYETIVNPDGSYARGSERPHVNPSELDFVRMTRNRQLDRTDAYSARLDITRPVTLFGAETSIKFGAQYDERTKNSNRTVIEANPASLAANGFAIPKQGDISINDPYKGALPLGYTFRYHDRQLGTDLLQSYIDGGATFVQPNTSEINNYEVSEQVLAGYAMATSYLDWGNIVAGVRVERVKNTGDALADTGSGFVPMHVSSDSILAFPSAHMNWDINDEMKFRLSFNTGAARPDYPDLRPNYTFSDDEQIVEGGNPLAKPEKAKGIDAYYEWYMPNRGFFSAGVFYKDLNDILFDVELPQFGQDFLDIGGVDRSGYTYATIANGGSGSIKGIEFALSQPLEGVARSLGLPDWMHGFGVQANLTLNDADATTPDGRKTDLPGASDIVYNTSLYYERYGLSARVSWQYRSKWLDSISSDTVIGDTYWDEVGRLDFSLRYAVNKNVEFYVDANNLLDEPGVRFDGHRSRTNEHETFGARYMLGVRLAL